MAQALGGARLKSRLGEYQEPTPEVARTEPRREYVKERPKRDPKAREEQREARAFERAKLRSRYDGYRTEWNAAKAPARADMYERQRRQRQELSERAKVEREKGRKKVRESGLLPEERRALYSHLALEAARRRRALTEAINVERAEFRAEKPQPYREWVTDRAQEGDPAAIRQVRGWAYQDRRTARAMERADAAAERGPSLMASDGQTHDTTLPPAHALDRLTYALDRRTGDLNYRLDGGDVFRHSGRWMRYSEAGQQNREAIEAGLLIAREAYGGQPLKITGPEDFRQRVVTVAIERGLDVKFSDPELERQRIEGVRTREAAQ
ncbi:LPD7 domain-containing protein, partial [Xanthomonas phaseoli]